MTCPRCGSPTYVYDTRMRNRLVRRVRHCGVKKDAPRAPFGNVSSCGFRFVTVEMPLSTVHFAVKVTPSGILISKDA